MPKNLGYIGGSIRTGHSGGRKLALLDNGYLVAAVGKSGMGSALYVSREKGAPGSWYETTIYSGYTGETAIAPLPGGHIAFARGTSNNVAVSVFNVEKEHATSFTVTLTAGMGLTGVRDVVIATQGERIYVAWLAKDAATPNMENLFVSVGELAGEGKSFVFSNPVKHTTLNTSGGSQYSLEVATHDTWDYAVFTYVTKLSSTSYTVNTLKVPKTNASPSAGSASTTLSTIINSVSCWVGSDNTSVHVAWANGSSVKVRSFTGSSAPTATAGTSVFGNGTVYGVSGGMNANGYNYLLVTYNDAETAISVVEYTGTFVTSSIPAYGGTSDGGDNAGDASTLPYTPSTFYKVPFIFESFNAFAGRSTGVYVEAYPDEMTVSPALGWDGAIRDKTNFATLSFSKDAMPKRIEVLLNGQFTQSVLDPVKDNPYSFSTTQAVFDSIAYGKYRKDRNLLLPFTSARKVHPNATVVAPYSLSLNATGNSQATEVDVPLLGEQDYTFQVSTNSIRIAIEFFDKDGRYIDGEYNIGNSAVTFTTPVGTTSGTIYYGNGTGTTGTFTFVNPVLTLGGTIAKFRKYDDKYNQLDIKTYSNEGFILVASASGQTLRKLDSLGNRIWQSTAYANASGAKFDKDGNVVVIQSTGTNLLGKLSPSGTVLWNKTSADTLPISEVAVDSKGNIITAGSGEVGEKVVQKYDPNGNPLWSKTDIRYARGVVVDLSDNIYVNHGSKIRKLDPSGNQLWFVDLSYSIGYMAICPDGSGIVVTHDLTPLVSLRKLNPDGGIVWGSNQFIYPSVLSVDQGGNIYCAFTASSNGGIKLSKFSPEGVEIWYRSDIGSVKSIAVDSLNDVYVGTHSISASTTTLYKMNPDGVDYWTNTGNSSLQEISLLPEPYPATRHTIRVPKKVLGTSSLVETATAVKESATVNAPAEKQEVLDILPGVLPVGKGITESRALLEKLTRGRGDVQDIVARIPMDVGDTVLLSRETVKKVTAINALSVLPANGVNDMSFSPDGRFLAIGTQSAPYLAYYEKYNDGYQLVPGAVPTIPSYTVTSVASSPDGVVLTVGSTAPSPISHFRRNGDSLVPASVAQPSGSVYGLGYSPDNGCLVIGGSGTTKMYLHQRTRDTLSSVTSNATFTGTGRGGTWTPDSKYMALASASTPYVGVWSRPTDTTISLVSTTSFSSGVAGSAYDVCYSPDGNHLAVAHNTAPFLTIFSRNGETYTKLTTPAATKTGNARKVVYSPDGKFLAVGGTGDGAGNYVTLYRRDGDTYTIQDVIPANTVKGAVNTLAFSRDGRQLFVGLSVAPFFQAFSLEYGYSVGIHVHNFNDMDYQRTNYPSYGHLGIVLKGTDRPGGTVTVRKLL